MALWDCSVREAWQHMGGEGLPDPEDVRYLKNVCRPVIKKSNLKSVKGKLVFQQALRAQEIKLLWLYP